MWGTDSGTVQLDWNCLNTMELQVNFSSGGKGLVHILKGLLKVSRKSGMNYSNIFQNCFKSELTKGRLIYICERTTFPSGVGGLIRLDCKHLKLISLVVVIQVAPQETEVYLTY